MRTILDRGLRVPAGRWLGLLLLGAFLALTGCSGGGGGGDGGGAPAASDWNDMQWDQSNWA